MLQADSLRQDIELDNIMSNNDTINNDMISEIEKELQHNSYDMISLVFLLYDAPEIALRQINMSQSSTNFNLLLDWYLQSKQKPTWKHEFVEALLLCQLNNIIRKLGLHVPAIQSQYQTNNMNIKMYIDPMKKALYQLCENMNASNLVKLKQSLQTYDINTSEYNSCEQVFLKLMCEKFIIIKPSIKDNNSALRSQVKLDKLLKIVEGLSGLQNLAHKIYDLQESINEDFQHSNPIAISTPLGPMKVDEFKEDTSSNLFSNDFDDLFSMIQTMNLEETVSIKNIKSDKTVTQQAKDCYVIKNPKNLGVCVILNQVNFYPSKNSLQEAVSNVSLDTRYGSEKDKTLLEKTMRALHFSVYSATDLNRELMFLYLKEIIMEKVTSNDSVFMLCILSHGVRDHIFTADSLKVNIDEFQNLLDSDIAVKLHNIPKLVIVQACQVKDIPHPILLPDSPRHSSKWKKTNCVICWATVPDMKAFRHPYLGSIFIWTLCDMFLKYSKTEHVCDILTKVTYTVQNYCLKQGYEQWPIHTTSFIKKLYLQTSQ